jgi:hypothetical protein
MSRQGDISAAGSFSHLDLVDSHASTNTLADAGCHDAVELRLESIPLLRRLALASDPPDVLLPVKGYVVTPAVPAL